MKQESKRPFIGLNANFEERKKAPWITVPGRYIDAVYETGGIPIIIPPLEDDDHLDVYMSFLDGFLFIGGDDYDPSLYGCKQNTMMELAHPRRSYHDLKMMKKVLNQEKPLLAICAGMQMMTIASGGKLIPHLETGMRHTEEYYHRITINKGSLLEKIFSETSIIVNSYHHQAVDPAFLGKGLNIIAYAPDGVAEAVSVLGRSFQLGVQWHPERIDDYEHRNKLFSAFIHAAIFSKET
ncbi:MAG: gamma-glutamyl-gamma-aminobutyrate hydrolase family protein [Candidatus Marinimicrobia bacterium]|nr:gamma-glutamyl-gamma-aminobutyrate hydrolase family protein [Candidatus Neomarinimicrobiota bacterium]